MDGPLPDLADVEDVVGAITATGDSPVGDEMPDDEYDDRA